MVENWLKQGGLPGPSSVRADGARWRVGFSPEHGIPETWVALAPSGPVWGPDQALAGLRLAKTHGVPAPRDARVLQRGVRMIFASTALEGPSGWSLIQGADSSGPERVMEAFSACLGALGRVQQNRPAELPGFGGFVEGPHASVGSRARVIAEHLASVGRDRGDETRALVAVCEACPPPPTYSLVHGRLDPGAIYLTPTGPVLDDWYWSHIGDPLEDWAAALVLHSTLFTELWQSSGVSDDEPELNRRLQASAALFALTHPEHPASPALVRIALTDGAVGRVLQGDGGSASEAARELDPVREALHIRLARSPVLSGSHLDAWVCAASLWALGEAGFTRADMARLGSEQVSLTGGSAVLHVSSDPGASVAHPLAGLVADVLGSRAPRAARTGADLLLSCAPKAPVEGKVGQLLMDLGLAASGDSDALERAESTCKDLGLWGQSGDLTHEIHLLEVVVQIQPHQRWLPFVLWCLLRLGERGQSLDPGMVQRLFGTLSIGR